MEETRDQRAMRASDADRDRIADVLRQAASDGRLSLAELHERIDALYAAKTYGELEPVVRDLPDALPDAPAPVHPPAAAPSADPVPSGRVGGRPARREGKAVFSGLLRRGQWVVPSDYRVKAVFGGVELDLREAQLETREVHIRAKAVFGGVNIIVPDDIRVDVDGDGVFGGFADNASTRQPPSQAPVLRVSGKAVFGGVNVQRKSIGEK
ncbi:DUF1707 domain-containing protein [Haloactinopolyspora sp.]|uniref:DUF1707 SHOCT-like domain-containing protein n=1 Tax=Haloactinopolyspora sp. TaxID=1966353 RepID=UPI00263187AD|nr:DUF1707 domain-containing protein [Haloactinopolyspora sp.]